MTRMKLLIALFVILSIVGANRAAAVYPSGTPDELPERIGVADSSGNVVGTIDYKLHRERDDRSTSLEVVDDQGNLTGHFLPWPYGFVPLGEQPVPVFEGERIITSHGSNGYGTETITKRKIENGWEGSAADGHLTETVTQLLIQE